MTEAIEAPPGAEATGRRIGPFEVRRLIGRGAMGEVWLAYDPMLEREIALKVLPLGQSLDAEAEQRLMREARAASALDHESIVRVHQLGEDAGRLFVAMEFVQGRTLAQVLQEDGPVPPRRVADLVDQVASALGTAHRAGLVHRDVKPDNLVLRPDGRVKVLDFGLVHAVMRRGPEPAAPAAPASQRTRSPSMALTETQLISGETVPMKDLATGVVGTPLYMAPEQLRGLPPTPAADQYALAASVYELLTGRRLRTGTTVGDVFGAAIEGRAPLPAPSGLPPAAEPVLARALAGEPTERYPTVDAFAAALRAAIAPPRRRRWALAAATLAAFAAAAGGFALRRPTPRAELEMAVTPGNRALFGQVFGPIADYFGRAVGRPVRAVIPPDYDATVAGVVSGAYSMAILSPKPYVEAKRRLPALVLAGGRYYTGEHAYRSLLVARRKGDGPRSVESLRAASMCFVSEESTTGYLLPRVMLKRAGIDASRDLGAVRFSGDHFNVLRDIRQGACVAGAVASMEFADARRQGIPTDDMEVVIRSDPLPPMAVVIHPGVDADTQAALRQAIRDAAHQLVIKNPLDVAEEHAQFGEVEDAAYDVIREMETIVHAP